MITFIIYVVGFVIAFLVIALLNDRTRSPHMSAAYAAFSWVFIIIVFIVALGEIKPTLKIKNDDK